MDRREGGAMLVDVLIGVTIVAAILAVAYPGFQVANDTISTSTQRDLIERSADRTLNGLVDAVRSGRIASITPSGTAPVVTLQSLQSGLTIGQMSGSNPTMWDASSRTIRYVPSSTLDESKMHVDLNRDGDQKDKFALGSLELVNGTQVTRLSGNARVLLGLPSYEGDVDGDGVADPLVELDGRELRIKITIARRTERGRMQATTVRSRIHLRNPQD